jgi:8-oxo-dGTP pyrophosphatase MutT (NUDIX family)
VDDDDRVVGRASRSEAHRLGLRHRFVQVLVVGSDGRVLLQQRSRGKKLGAHLMDASVGGHVDAGESYAQAVRREASEELALPADGEYLELGTIEDTSPGVENMVGRLFVYRSDGPFSGWEAEAERLEWVSREDLATLADRFPYLCTGGLLSSIRLFLSAPIS